MTQLVRAELLKMRTLRSFWWTAAAVLAGVPVLLSANITRAGGTGMPALDSPEGIRNVFSSNSSALMLIIGILLMAGEFRHGTAASTFLATPHRTRVVRAKLLAAAAVGVAFAALAATVTLAIALPWLDAKGVDVAAHAHDVVVALLGSMAVTALYAFVGVGLGVLIRNQTVAVTVALVWMFVIESAVLALIPALGRWLPGGAAGALSGAALPEASLLPMWGGALLFAAYGVAFAAAGTRLITRRDVA